MTHNLGTNWQFEPITDVSDAEVSDAKDAPSEPIKGDKDAAKGSTRTVSFVFLDTED